MSQLAMSPAYASGERENPAEKTKTTRPVPRIHPFLIIFSLTFFLALMTASECHSITHIPSLIYGIVLWCWWGGVASSLWKLGQIKPNVLRFSLPAISFHILAGSILAVVHLLLLGGVGFTNRDWMKYKSAIAVWTELFQINRFGFDLLLYGFVFGIAGIIYLQIQAQRETMRSLELQKQLSTAHLRALQMQMEPHFLFNTLNAITTLVELGRQKEAAEMLSHLNAILKATLKRTTPEKVPLAQELEIVENYLAIEQIRFADRLKVEIKVDPSALDGLVPCFLLQPIVENAIRHGVAHCEDDGVIHTSIERDGSRLHMRVRDNGPGWNGKSQPGHGIGLKNTEDRLAHFYEKEYDFNAGEPKSGGFEVAITIPYEQALA